MIKLRLLACCSMLLLAASAALGQEVTLEQPKGISLTAGASTVNWGSVGYAPAGSPRTFIVRNDGAAALTGLAVTIDTTPEGNAAAEFTVSTPLGATALAQGESTTFTVTFRPTANNLRTATLHVTSNAESSFDVTLAATGDNLPPSLTSVSVSSSGVNPVWARAGDKITVDFTSNEALQSPAVTIAGQMVTLPGKGTIWKAEVTANASSPQGRVSVSIDARDLAGNLNPVTLNPSAVTIDTKAPILTLPADLRVEATEPGGAYVNYPPAIATDANAVTINYFKAAGTLFPRGTTTVTVGANDVAGNGVKATFNVTVLDTTAPTITGTFFPRTLQVGQRLPNYFAQATVLDASAITSKVQTPAAGSYLYYEGIINVTLTARDAPGHSSSTSFPVTVRPAGPRSQPLYSSATGLGDPAIDDDGTVVLTSTATIAGAGRQTVLFSPARIFARTGWLTTGVVGIEAIGNPVIDRGHVAALGTLRRAGAPNVQAILDLPAGAGLSYAQRSSFPAADTGGATFKSFTQIGVSGSSLAFLAQLTMNTGLPKTTATSDTGVWAQDATHPVKLLLREGQEIGGKKIKTLVTFQPGNGSPGQGRGWVLNVNGVTQVHALAMFTDGTQALLRADNEGHLTTLTATAPKATVALFHANNIPVTPPPQAPDRAGLPTLPGTTFASFSFPALNALGDHAFLGTLTAGAGGVTAANSRAIFLNDPSTGSYDAIARLGDPASGVLGVTAATGAKFATLYDPVLASDGGLAFRSLLAGVKPGNNDSLWWQPPGQPLKLLAQEGQQPAGSTVASEKWLGFTSLAIASNGGPLFIATVTGGRSGLWATDFTGTLRLIFCTGDLINGKKLASFAVLKAVPGNMGTTRNFNGSQQILWRATFSDRTTAIMESIVP